MGRVTEKNLEALTRTINQMAGLPEEPYRRLDNGRLEPVPGVFLLYVANGGYSLHKMSDADEDGTPSSSEHCILSASTKRDLYDQMSAYAAGLQFGRKAVLG